MADVFLSYAREDVARAQQVAEGLGQAGLDVFWDSEIPPGTTWADYIEQKLTQCKALIVLWSEHSTKSQWVREEARMGRDKGVLIPVMIDASTPPFGFGEVQAANLASWNGEQDNPNWRRFVDAVTRFSQTAPATQMQPAPTAPRAAATPAASWSAPSQQAAQAEQKKGIPTWAWIAGGAVGAVVVLGIIGSMLPSDPPAAPVQQQQQIAAPQNQPVNPNAPAGENPQAIILAQLQQAQMAAAQQGFQLIGQPYSGSLAQGQSWNVPAELHAGVDYRVLAVCDRDCNDLDLVVFDASGAPVAQDTSTSNQPIVAIQPGYVGAFTVQVQMFNCTVAPCYYAIALYGRPLQ